MSSKGNATLELLIVVSLIIGTVLLILGYLPYKVFLVQSGSMEPSIMTGDVVVIKKNTSYSINQVITFTDSDKRIVTHRIIENGKRGEYITKGDANQSSDTRSVENSQIMGTVVLVIPKIGYLIRFIKTPAGLIIFIFLPAVFIILMEMKNIHSELHK
jgi:signal peptidase I